MPPRAMQTVGVAARNGDLESIKTLLESGHPADVMDNRGFRPTHEAASNNHVNCLKLLLQQAVTDSEWQTFDGRTALHVAAGLGHQQCLKVLLDANANVETADCMMITPLMAATRAKSVECVEYLLQDGADPNGQDFCGSTALHEAVSMGNVDIVELLISSGVRLDIREQYDITAIFCAAHKGQYQCLKILLNEAQRRKQTYLVNMPAHDGGTPLYLAAQEGNKECVELLLEHGAKPNLMTDDPPALAIHAALQFGHVECVKILMPLIDVAKLPLCEPNIFDYAFTNDSTDCLTTILEMGADVNYRHAMNEYEPKSLRYVQHGVKYSRRMTPLCWLAGYHTGRPHHLNHAQVLISAGCRVNASNPTEVPPLLMALDEEALKLVLLLVQNGAAVNCYHPRIVGNMALIVTLHRWNSLNLVLRLGAEADSLFGTAGTSLSSHSAMCGNDAELAYDSDQADSIAQQGSVMTFYETLLGTRYLMSRLNMNAFRLLTLLLHFVATVRLDDHFESLMDAPQWQIISSLTAKPRTLSHLCRHTIRRCFTPQQLLKESDISSLPLPQQLLDFLLYKELPFNLS